MCYDRKRAAGLNELGKMLNSIELIEGLSDSLICKCALVISKKGLGEGRALQTYSICFSLVALMFFLKTLQKNAMLEKKSCAFNL